MALGHWFWGPNQSATSVTVRTKVIARSIRTGGSQAQGAGVATRPETAGSSRGTAAKLAKAAHRADERGHEHHEHQLEDEHRAPHAILSASCDRHPRRVHRAAGAPRGLPGADARQLRAGPYRASKGALHRAHFDSVNQVQRVLAIARRLPGSRSDTREAS